MSGCCSCCRPSRKNGFVRSSCDGRVLSDVLLSMRHPRSRPHSTSTMPRRQTYHSKMACGRSFKDKRFMEDSGERKTKWVYVQCAPNTFIRGRHLLGGDDLMKCFSWSDTMKQVFPPWTTKCLSNRIDYLTERGLLHCAPAVFQSVSETLQRSSTAQDTIRTQSRTDWKRAAMMVTVGVPRWGLKIGLTRPMRKSRV